MRPEIGVLAVQGDVAEHVTAIERVGGEPVHVKRPRDLEHVDGLILPGGESTAHRRLLDFEDLATTIKARHDDGMALFGTCAGAILLASEVVGAEAPHLSLIDMTVRRNAFGPQRASFVTELDVAGIDGGPIRAVFIRAPIIERVGPGVRVLATIDDSIAVAATDRVLVTSFHPELTGDVRLHRRFLEMASRVAGGPGLSSVGQPGTSIGPADRS